MTDDHNAISRSDGRPVQPLPYIGWKARLEQWLHRHGRHRAGRLMGRWDERGLGR